jgi:hypothetical protein
MQAPLARVRPRKPLAMVAADTGRGAAPLCSPTNQTKRTASLHPGTETDNDPSLRRTVPARHLRSLLWPADRDKEIFVSPLNCASCSCQHDPVHVLLVRGMTRTRRTGRQARVNGRAGDRFWWRPSGRGTGPRATVLWCGALDPGGCRENSYSTPHCSCTSVGARASLIPRRGRP